CRLALAKRTTTLCGAAATQSIELAQLLADVLRAERQIAACLDECPLTLAAEEEAQEFPNGGVQRLPRRDIHDRRDDPGQRILLGDQRLHARRDIGSGRCSRKLQDLDRGVGEAGVGYRDA